MKGALLIAFVLLVIGIHVHGNNIAENDECPTDIDDCIFMVLNGNCTGDHEICVDGKCSCKSGYIRRGANGYCEEYKCRKCWKEKYELCEHGHSGAVKCTCKNGYYNGFNCEKYGVCETGVSKCDHTCNITNGNCSCETGFKLAYNNYTCEISNMQLKCSASAELRCNPGACVHKDGTDTCICPPATHDYLNDTCFDKCTVNNGIAPEDLNCPASSGCEFKGGLLRCICIYPYEQSEDDIHCKFIKICERLNAKSDCDRRSAICEEDNSNGKGYKCKCKEGFQFEDGVCKRICDLTENRMKCAKSNAVCELKEKFTPYCRCPPLLARQSPDGPCNKLADASYTGEISFLKSKYELAVDPDKIKRSGDLADIDSIKLMKDLETLMKCVYGCDYEDTKVLQCKVRDPLLECTIELQLNKYTEDVNAIVSPRFCYPVRLDVLDGENCVVNRHFLLKRNNETGVFQKTHPCDEVVKNSVCGSFTNCIEEDEKNFKCLCKEGFLAIGSYKLVSDSESYIEKCNDIDECATLENPCGNNTVCLNTYGSYECACKEGFRKLHPWSDPKIDGCTEIDPCIPNPCKNNGQCFKDGNKPSCVCVGNFTGELCETVLLVDLCLEKCGVSQDAPLKSNVSQVKCVVDTEENVKCECTEMGQAFVVQEKICKETCDSDDQCENGAICEDSDNENAFCMCRKGTSGNRCEIVDECENFSCGSDEEVQCTYDLMSETAACRCRDPRKAYDYRDKKCNDIDACIFMILNLECTGPHEICINGKCSCMRGYRRIGGKGYCEENIWEKCQKDNYDYLKIDGPGAVKCACKNGYYDGFRCVKYRPCEPGISKCKQKCSEKTGKCSCVEGFKLANDSYTCEIKNNQIKCSLPCHPGSCVKNDGTEMCICPPATHVIRDNKCVDLCTVNWTTENLKCPPSSSCEFKDNNLRCLCEHPYEQAEDGVHCKRKKMCDQDIVKLDCEEKSALCEEDASEIKGYKCKCRKSFEMEDNVCKRVCDLKANRKKCAQKNAVCELSELRQNPLTPSCRCPPMLTKDSSDENAPCNKFAESSFMGKMSFLKTIYELREDPGEARQLTELGYIDYVKLNKDLEESIKYVYGENGYEDTKILHCELDDILLVCTVELQLQKEVEVEYVNKITSPKICYPLDLEHNPYELCIIHPNLVLKREIETEMFQKTKPCDEIVKNSLCESSTTCISEDQKSFKCLCKEGFRAIGAYKPIIDSDTYVEKCNDINECITLKKPCGKNTHCWNIHGNYTCTCKDGFRKISVISDPKIDGCTAICDPNPCENEGECIEVTNHAFSCKCKPPYAGVSCKDKALLEVAEVVEDYTKVTIVGGVLGTLLILTLIVATICYQKLKKRKESNENRNTTDRQRSVQPEIDRLRHRSHPGDLDREMELHTNGSSGRSRGESGEYRQEFSDSRRIQEIQTSMHRETDVDRWNSSSDSGLPR